MTVYGGDTCQSTGIWWAPEWFRGGPGGGFRGGPLRGGLGGAPGEIPGWASEGPERLRGGAPGGPRRGLEEAPGGLGRALGKPRGGPEGAPRGRRGRPGDHGTAPGGLPPGRGVKQQPKFFGNRPQAAKAALNSKPCSSVRPAFRMNPHFSAPTIDFAPQLRFPRRCRPTPRKCQPTFSFTRLALRLVLVQFFLLLGRYFSSPKWL